MTSIASHVAALALRLSGARNRLRSDNPDRERLIARRSSYARPTRAMRRRFKVDWYMCDGFEVYTISPRISNSKNQIMYLHGGAYVEPITSYHWSFISKMVNATGLKFIVPFYPLAPEHDCERLYGMVNAVYQNLLEKHQDASLIVMGDSAGGGIALSLAMQVRDLGLTRPLGLVLLSPWLDVTMTDVAQASIEPSDVMLMRPGLRSAGRMYAGNRSTTDYRVSPLFGDLTDLPPIQMFCGSNDILVVDARRLAERARDSELDLAYNEEPGMMHVYAILNLPESRLSQDLMRIFIHDALGDQV